MSVLPPEVHAALDKLLQGLQSTDNNLRAQAEEELNTQWTQARPDVLLMGLVEQLHGSQDTAVRLDDTGVSQQSLTSLCYIGTVICSRHL